MFSPAEDPKSLHADSDKYVQIIHNPNAEWFHQPSGKILLLIIQEQVGNCSGDVNGVILDRHQYRREHNLAPWILPTKARLCCPMTWLWQPVSLSWCLTQLPWKSMWAFALIKTLFSRPFWQSDQINGPVTYFDWSSHPRWCWPNCCLISRLTLLRLGVQIRWLSKGCSDLKYSLFLYNLVTNRAVGDTTML